MFYQLICTMLVSRRIHCCPEWARSSYTNLIDTQLHSAMRLISGCLQPTQLSWVLVLSSVAPPSLSRKAATDKLLQIIEADPNWPVYADVFPRLCPIWSDMTSVDTITQWREDWSSASVVNHTIVTDPTVRQSGFDLPCYIAYIAWNAVCVCLYVCWLRP